MSESTDTITVPVVALHQVMRALLGPGHHIRELQATMTPAAVFPDNPINILRDHLEQFYVENPDAPR